jgi:hypothetical protein
MVLDEAFKLSARDEVLQLPDIRKTGIHPNFAGLPSPHEEWVYNPANIDAAPVIWALDLGPTENEKLRRYYAGRSFWRFKPAESMSLRPY